MTGMFELCFIHYVFLISASCLNLNPSIDEENSTQNDEPIIVTPGKPTTLTCVFRGTDDSGLKWFKMPVADNNGFVIGQISIDNSMYKPTGKFTQTKKHTDLTDTTHFSLTINDFSEKDTASYRCRDGNQLERDFEVKFSVCEEVEAEDMIKHVYVKGDNLDGIELKCPVENKLFRWEAQYLPDSSGFEYIYHPYDPEKSKYYVSGDSLNTFALNIGSPERGSSGIYCCSRWHPKYTLDWTPPVTHAVLIFTKDPEIKLTSSKKISVNNGDKISLQCSEQTTVDQLSRERKVSKSENISETVYLKPITIWERDNDQLRNAQGPKFDFEVTPEFHNATFRCGWRYENLNNDGSSRTFYSNRYYLNPFLDEKESTQNKEPIEVFPGDSTTLTCVFKGVDVNDLRWIKVPVDTVDHLALDYKTGIDNEMKFVEATKQTDKNSTIYFSLTINDFSENDTASYRCKGSNQLERSFELKVKTTPVTMNEVTTTLISETTAASEEISETPAEPTSNSTSGGIHGVKPDIKEEKQIPWVPIIATVSLCLLILANAIAMLRHENSENDFENQEQPPYKAENEHPEEPKNVVESIFLPEPKDAAERMHMTTPEYAMEHNCAEKHNLAAVVKLPLHADEKSFDQNK